jgi:hypothetical protein
LPIADAAAAEMLQLDRHLNEEGEASMSTPTAEQVRAVRIEAELRLRASPERVFGALTQDTLAWFPHTYGQERVRALVLEPRVGGLHYEDWGDGMGHLYGQVTVFDHPHAFSARGRLMAGVILDSEYVLHQEGDATVLKMTKVAVGPMTDEEAASIRTYSDISLFAEALRSVVGPPASGEAR